MGILLSIEFWAETTVWTACPGDFAGRTIEVRCPA